MSVATAPKIETKEFKLVDIDADLELREVSGYAATWDLDQVGDRIEKGAFARTIKARGPNEDTGRSKIKVLWQHYQPIGIPLEMREDEKGLFVRARISKTSLGDEALTLIRDGVVDRMSIGFDVVKREIDDDTGIRVLKEIRLFEFSFVTFPANENAIITGVKELDHLVGMMSDQILSKVDKQLEELRDIMRDYNLKAYSATGDKDLPLGDREEDWSGSDARKALADWAKGDDEELDLEKENHRNRYRKGFVLSDSDKDDVRGGYKLPFATVKNGNLTAMPRGIFAAAGAVQGARTELDVPESAKGAARDFLAAYYDKLDETPPWEDDKSLEDEETTVEDQDEEVISVEEQVASLTDTVKQLATWVKALAEHITMPDDLKQDDSPTSEDVETEEESSEEKDDQALVEFEEDSEEKQESDKTTEEITTEEKEDDELCVTDLENLDLSLLEVEEIEEELTTGDDSEKSLVEGLELVTKAGRRLSRRSREKVEEAITALQALLEESDESESEEDELSKALDSLGVFDHLGSQETDSPEGTPLITDDKSNSDQDSPEQSDDSAEDHSLDEELEGLEVSADDLLEWILQDDE